MADVDERVRGTGISAWGDEPADVPARRRWPQALRSWLNAAGVVKEARSSAQAARPQGDRSSAEMTTLPAVGRGQALREAHRSLRRHLKRHRPLRGIMPHLHFIEQSLARQGSAALTDLPVWVMQRGLQQLARLPWDEHSEPSLHPLQTLRLRLIEAIETRGPRAVVRHASTPEQDSFSGSLDEAPSSCGPESLPPAGIVVDELPDSDFDRLPGGSMRHGARDIYGTGLRKR